MSARRPIEANVSMRSPFEDKSGQGLVEYALIVAFIAIIAIVALRVLGTRASGVFTCTGQAIDHPITANCGSGGTL
jgi:pilus assembly protein Flp/PilA